MSFEDNHAWCLKHDNLYLQTFIEMKIQIIGGWNKLFDTHFFPNRRGFCHDCGLFRQHFYKSFITKNKIVCRNCFKKEIMAAYGLQGGNFD